MRLIEKLKEYENQYMFIKWATGGEYGKLVYAGDDFIEFNINPFSVNFGSSNRRCGCSAYCS